jgi:hypothetical protein
MDYQTVEQFWCKLTASDDWISQLACYAHQNLRLGTAAFRRRRKAGPRIARVAALTSR